MVTLTHRAMYIFAGVRSGGSQYFLSFMYDHGRLEIVLKDGHELDMMKLLQGSFIR